MRETLHDFVEKYSEKLFLISELSVNCVFKITVLNLSDINLLYFTKNIGGFYENPSVPNHQVSKNSNANLFIINFIFL